MDQDKSTDQEPCSTPSVSSSIQIPTPELPCSQGQSSHPGVSQNKGQQSHTPTGLVTRSETSDDEVQYLMTVPRRRKRNQNGTNDMHQERTGTMTGTRDMSRGGSVDISKDLESCHLSNFRSNGLPGFQYASQPYQQLQSFEPLLGSPHGNLQYDISQQLRPPLINPQRLVTRPSQSVSIPTLEHGTESEAKRLCNGLRLGQPERTFSCGAPQPHCYTSPMFTASNNNTDFTSPPLEQLFMDVLWPPASAIEQVFPDHTNFNWNTLTWESSPANVTTSPLATTSVQKQTSTNTEEFQQKQRSCPEKRPPTARETSRPSPTTAHVYSADLRRKPTLYQIPAWTPPTSALPAPEPTESQCSPTVSSDDNSQAAPLRSTHSRSPSQTTCFTPSVVPPPKFNFNCDSFLRTPHVTPESPAPVSPRTKVPKTLPAMPISQVDLLFASPERSQSSFRQEKPATERASSIMQAPLPSTQNTTAQLMSLNHHTKSSDREQPQTQNHSANLIVDIAQTCQERFPFEEVARRHNTKIEKVIDTFSAIIQLPLLRNASDSRRHGPLGSQRMKDFREAKKAAKAAQHAERKAMKHHLKSHSDEPVQKRIKVGEKVEDLRKAAMLKNAREAQVNSAP